MTSVPHSPRCDRVLPAETRRILHLDVDAFLASVEQALYPELRGRAVVVGGPPTSRNLVMSCSYEARRFGVHAGMRLAEAARRCPLAIFRDGDSQAANRLRDRATRALLAFTPKVEVASIDDFFLDLSGSARQHGAARDAAERIRRAVREASGLPLSIGIATNKTLARIAGKLAKPGGIAEILPGYEETFLTALPIDHLPGVGRSIGAELERFGIRTAGDLRAVPREVLFTSFGRDGLVLFERVRGRDPAPVEATHAEDGEGRLVARAPRSIRREATFEPEEGRRELLEAMLSYLVERAAHRLRAHGLAAGTLAVYVIWVDTHPRRPLEQEESGLSAARTRSLGAPSDSTDELWQVARALLGALPRKRALVKRVGLSLTNLRPSAGWQGRLYSEPSAEDGAADAGHAASRADRQRRLDRALDRLRERLGFGRILRGSSAPLQETHALRADGFRLRTPSLNQ